MGSPKALSSGPPLSPRPPPQPDERSRRAVRRPVRCGRLPLPRLLRAGAEGREAARPPQGPPPGPPLLSGGHRGGEGLGVPGERPARTRWKFLLLSPIPGVSCRGVSVPPWPRCLAAPPAAAARALRGG